MSFAQSVRQARARARERDRDVLEYLVGTPESTLRAVFAEDGAALIGIVLAALGVLLHQLTGIAQFDAAASIAIGLLLAVTALFLIDRNRRLLIGGATEGRMREWIVRLLEQEESIDHVTYLHIEIVGPRQVFVVAAVDLVGDEPESRVADRLRAIEDRLEASPPIETAVLTIASYREPAITAAEAEESEGTPPSE
jgi:divalent metal cation (Fe/Co/Zn/Cd) transporter